MNVFEGIDVGGPAFFRNDLYAYGNETVSGTLTGLGALTVTGVTTFNGGIATTGTFTLTGTWDGWIGSNETWTYVSSTTFTVASDVTGKYQLGDKIKLTQTTAKYFYVIATPTFGAGVTTITVSGGTDYTLANAAITSPFYSKVDNPQAFPGWFTYTTTYTGWSANPSGQICRFAMSGRIVFITIDTPTISNGTSNSTSASMTVPIAAKSDVIFPISAFDGANILGLGRTNPASTTLTLYHDTALGNWVAAGNKSVRASFSYEAN